MARYIDKTNAADIISEKMNIPLGDLVDVFAEIPTADVVEVKAIEQLKWERDTAIKQLQAYGVGLGENKELAEVKHREWKDKFNRNIMLTQSFCLYNMSFVKY